MTNERTPRLYQRGDNGYPIGADEIMKQAYGVIPEAIEFQHGGGRGTPERVHGWQWSSDFSCWSALVTFADGWHGFTYPVPEQQRTTPQHALASTSSTSPRDFRQITDSIIRLLEQGTALARSRGMLPEAS